MDTPLDICLIRSGSEMAEERGEMESVLEQYQQTVRLFYGY